MGLNELLVIIDTLDDVDLSTKGPVGPHRPKRGPYRTTVRHVVKVGNNETMVERVHGTDANAYDDGNDDISDSSGPPSPPTLKGRPTNCAARRVEDLSSCQRVIQSCYRPARRQGHFAEHRVSTDSSLGHQ